MMHTDTPALMPVRYETPALAVANEVGFQPACQTMLTGRPYQTIGQQDKDAVGKGRSFFGPGQQLVEDAPQSEAIEERAHGQDRPPGRGIDDRNGIRIFSSRHRRAE
jgi:hypothetical protein